MLGGVNTVCASVIGGPRGILTLTSRDENRCFILTTSQRIVEIEKEVRNQVLKTVVFDRKV